MDDTLDPMQRLRALVDSTDRSGSGYDETAELVRAGLDPDGRDEYCLRTLWIASRAGCVGAVGALLDAGADVNSTNDVGETALHGACDGGHPDVALALVARGADVHARDACGRTPAFNAAMSKNVACLDVLLARGARVDAKAHGDLCMTTIAIVVECPSVFERLLRAGAPVPFDDLSSFSSNRVPFHRWSSQSRARAKRDAELLNLIYPSL